MKINQNKVVLIQCSVFSLDCSRMCWSRQHVHVVWNRVIELVRASRLFEWRNKRILNKGFIFKWTPSFIHWLFFYYSLKRFYCCAACFKWKLKAIESLLICPKTEKRTTISTKWQRFSTTKGISYVHNGFFNHHLSNYKLIESSTFTLVFIPFIFEA